MSKDTIMSPLDVKVPDYERPTPGTYNGDTPTGAPGRSGSGLPEKTFDRIPDGGKQPISGPGEKL